MRIYDNFKSLIGNTPLFELANLVKSEVLSAKIFAKLEFFNPAGSIKDRTALYMIADAEKKGLLKNNSTIIEPTSGNTGIGLSAIGTAKGYRVVLTMPETMSIERRKLLKAYGAEVVLTDGKKGMMGAIEKAHELNKDIPNSYIPSQFTNSANIDAHYNTTGPEIWNDTDGTVDVVVAGVGTGGTISGIGRYLKEKNKNIKIFAVEPESSPMITKGKFGAHKIQGIGANFVPKNFDSSICDGVFTATDLESIVWARKVAKAEGLLVGISSGAALAVASKIAKEKAYFGKNIVVIFPDGGEKYLSTELFEE